MADLAWRLRRQGYDAVAADRVARAEPGADTHVSRLLGRRTLVVRGAEGARAWATLRVLGEVDYQLASPSVVDRSRMPTLPAGGLRISVAPAARTPN